MVFPTWISDIFLESFFFLILGGKKIKKIYDFNSVSYLFIFFWISRKHCTILICNPINPIIISHNTTENYSSEGQINTDYFRYRFLMYVLLIVMYSQQVVRKLGKHNETCIKTHMPFLFMLFIFTSINTILAFRSFYQL